MTDATDKMGRDDQIEVVALMVASADGFQFPTDSYRPDARSILGRRSFRSWMKAGKPGLPAARDGDDIPGYRG